MKRRARWPALVMVVGVVAAFAGLVRQPTSAAQTPNPCDQYGSGYDDLNITWTDVTPPQGSALRYPGYAGVFFVDQNKGWAVGTGQIVFTEDGGAVWKVPTSIVDQNGSAMDVRDASFHRVFFVDRTHGWVIDRSGIVLATTDGGMTWRRQPLDLPTPDPAKSFSLNSIFLVETPGSGLRGWITATEETTASRALRGYLFTTDGDGDWDRIDPKRLDPPGYVSVLDVTFFDGSNGLATSDIDYSDGRDDTVDGAIFATADGGHTWKLEEKNPNVDLQGSRPRSAGGFQYFSFSDPTHGHVNWIRNSSQDGEIWRATPGAHGERVWEQQNTCTPYTAQTPAFVGGRNCAPPELRCNGLVADTFGRAVSRTKNQGETWVPDVGPRVGPAGVSTFDLSYPAATVAYASGELFTGKIFKASISLVEVNKIEPAEALCPREVVTITGSGFFDDSSVSFGSIGVPKQDVTLVSNTELKVKVPPPAVLGTVDVTVTTPGLGTSVAYDKTKFTYEDPTRLPPTVASVSPNKGKVAGGEEVTISGTRLKCAHGVSFTDRTGTRTVNVPEDQVQIVGNAGEEMIKVKAPPWPDPSGDEVQVVVITLGTGSTPVPSVPEAPGADAYTYLGLPTVGSLVPSKGPATGGGRVTIRGTGLEETDKVFFGDIEASGVEVKSPTELTAILPAHDPGPVAVTVTTPARGASVDPPVPQFTYHPGISTIFPPSGPIDGGTEVTISGRGFAGTNQVRFGPELARFTERSDTELVAIAPPHATPELVPVHVEAGGLTSLPDDVLFSYGPSAGGGGGGGGGGGSGRQDGGDDGTPQPPNDSGGAPVTGSDPAGETAAGQPADPPPAPAPAPASPAAGPAGPTADPAPGQSPAPDPGPASGPSPAPASPAPGGASSAPVPAPPPGQAWVPAPGGTPGASAGPVAGASPTPAPGSAPAASATPLPPNPAPQAPTPSPTPGSSLAPGPAGTPGAGPAAGGVPNAGPLPVAGAPAAAPPAPGGAPPASAPGSGPGSAMPPLGPATVGAGTPAPGGAQAGPGMAAAASDSRSRAPSPAGGTGEPAGPSGHQADDASIYQMVGRSSDEALGLTATTGFAALLLLAWAAWVLRDNEQDRVRPAPQQAY